MSHLRLTLAALSSTALLAAAGAGPALAQDTAGTYPTAPSAGGHGGHGGHHGRGHRGGPRKLSDAQLTTIATQLGTTLDALKAAMAKVQATVKASAERETKAQEAALLATELGVTADAVTAAFEAARPAPGAGGREGHGPCKGKGKGSGSGSGSGSGAGTYPTAPTPAT